MNEPTDTQKSKPEGIHIPLAEDFDHFSKSYHSALTSYIQSLEEMNQSQNDMELASLQVEMNVINEAGEEKKVGPNETARNRTYDVAKQKSIAFTSARNNLNSARQDCKYHQGMLDLFKLRLKFMIATAQQT